jgi:polyketide synthase PksN
MKMKDLLEYIYNEVKNKRLDIKDAMDLLRQFETQIGSTNHSFLHPLLHQNTSDLLEQKFSSTFTGREFFLEGHIINGQPVMPAVVYLEMARAAVEQAAGSLREGQTGIRLNNIIWARPIVIGDEPAQVHIRLYPEDSDFLEGNGKIFFEIYSDSLEADKEPIINSRGSAVFSPVMEVPTLDLKFLQTQYTVWSPPNNLEQRGIEKILIRQEQVLAKLSLPTSVLDTKDQFVLHPILMEAAVEASVGLLMNSGDMVSPGSKAPVKSFIPTALQEVEIFHSCTSSMWALIGYNKNTEVGDKPSGNIPVQKLNIDICDETGTVCIRMKGMEMYETTNAQIALTVETEEAHELMTFEEVWQEETLVEEDTRATSPLEIKTMVCFLTNPENQQIFAETIRTHDPKTEIIFVTQNTNYHKQSPQMYNIPGTDPNAYREAFQSIRQNTRVDSRGGEVDAILYLWAFEDPRYIQDYSSIVYLLQAISYAKLTTKRVLFGAQFENELDRCYLESWIGFERTLRSILPNTQVAVIYQAVYEQNPETAIKDWSQKLRSELQTPKIQSVLYQNGKRHVYRIQPITLPAGNNELKPGRTYFITGGCGGLGLLFAGHLAKRSTPTEPVNLILTGRSPLDAEKHSKIKALEDLGSRVAYVQADIGNSAHMKKGLNQAKDRFGAIHGVIHAAGIIDEQNIFDNDIQRFQKVIEPKIKGTLLLDELLKDEPLDFICYFSSMTAILGDFGSCDYAIGNRFQMAYAHYHNQQQSKGLFHGKAIAIVWPIWRDGGMKFADDEAAKFYFNSSGQRFLEAEEGLAMFDRILAQNKAQPMVLAGQPSQIHRILGLTKDRTDTSALNIPDSSGDTPKRTRGRKPEMKGWSLEQCLEWDLKGNINRLLKIPRDKIDSDQNLVNFGFNSISLTQFAILLIKHFGINEITPALFFKYFTVEKLTKYLLNEHQSTIREFYQMDMATPTTAPREPIVGNIPKLPAGRARFTKRSFAAPNIPEPIAIIGMSGRFPEARNIEELWSIIVSGRDVVREIPKERFDVLQYYGPSGEPGKTNCKWLGCVPGVGEFEPLFFEISPREAETMDPRQRLLLQESWKALEDAGYGKAQLTTEKVGMYVGADQGDYQVLTQGEGSIGSNHNAILAARLAYFLNLHGPVMAIDTACSSGLVAAHQGILSIRNGECDTVVVAGIFLMLTPLPLIAMGQAGMLSEDGKCYAFDKRANGMVPGEAVAVVVLKRLSRAEADGDPIYAVIKGSGINYDGKTNGITAPSGVSQTELLKQVYNQYQVNPEEIEYIVTHGTGTRLGDPVEINALYDAFKDYSCPGTSRYSASHPGAPKQGYCALTSTKTNFGHTQAASGLVSLISLVQALRHEIIPASLHCEEENDYINWKESPFYVNKANKPWPGAASGALRDGRAISTANKISGSRVRTGAVSAFGMSGTNAHMVVESYARENNTMQVKTVPNYLLAFSAKTQEALAEKLKDMIEVLENGVVEQDLTRISYTLLEGRHHFNYRCATVVQDRGHAISVLKQILAKEKMPNVFQGKVPREFTGQTAIEQYAQDLLKQSFSLRDNRNKYQETISALADLYCQGYQLNWQQLFGDTKPDRMHLPTYPFARERYWAPVRAYHDMPQRATIHPLLQQNTSDLSEQRYSSTFTGREFFLKDHVIMGQRVLPGVAYLEMARAAVAAALNGMAFNAEATNATTFDAASAGSSRESNTMIRLRNVVWARPIGVGEQPMQVHIGLYPEDDAFSESGCAFREGGGSAFFEGEIAYEIYSLTDTDEAEPVVYSQGSATLDIIREIPVLDLPTIQAECNQRNLSAAEVYDFYKAIGVEYGPGHRGVEQIYAGQGRVIAKLSLPDSVAETEEQYVLHPSIMDAALQASIGMIQTGDTNGIVTSKPSLPFALQELEIYNHCSSNMWAVIEYSKGNMASNKVQKVDIDLCDEQGQVCVRIKGFSSRTLENGIVEAGAASARARACRVIKNIMLEPVWEEQAAPNPEANSRTRARKVPEYTQQLVILCESGEITPESIENELNGVRVLNLQTKQKDIEKRFEVYAVRIFEEIQKIFEAKPIGKALVQVVVSRQGEQQLFAGLSGILKTAGLENPKVIGQLIELEAMEGLEGLIAKVKENARLGAIYRPMDNMVRYQGGKRLALGWNEVTVASETAAIPWKDGGVYLITGGAGGLGRIFAKEIAARVKDVTLILTGRSSLDENRKANFTELNGAKVIYRQVDVADKKSVNELIASIVEEFGKLDGVIHCAGVIRDNYILKKTKEELMEVLAPKVAGLVNLDAASKDLNLDFMILFSSTAGSLGNPGQVDYATANAFMDAYAEYRNDLVSSGQRHGKTLSINWPLWQEGGMRVDETVEKMMSQNTGLIAMRTSTGIQALYDAIASGRNQVMVLEGDIQKIQATYIKQAAVSESENINSSRTIQELVTVANPDQLREKVSNYLKKLLAPVIKLPVERIEADTPLEKYGIDSIMAMQLTNQLEKTFGSLSKTLFFEYQTILELSGYFLESYREQLNQLIGIEKKEEITRDTGTIITTGPIMPVIRNHHRSRFVSSGNLSLEGKNIKTLDIAIIGVSGRYPQARNLDEFWINLRSGKDCITEIPKDRWDHSLYYDEDKNKLGKTYSKWGGFLEGVDHFDPLFFNISPREAEFMDPQERLFLECVYETLEDAGYTREILGKYQGLGLEGNVGVYVGVMYEEYQLYGAQAQVQGFPIALSGNPSSIANRVSYFCNFHGPSVAVDTMCSSSLTAIHLACQSIQREGCELAIAGGVNVSIHPNKYLMLAQGKFASSKGRCESFGEGGDGYVPGEGVGAVLLKPLSKAIADGDQIYGVIKGTAINHGGKTNGYSVPNPNAQAGVIGQALREAGIDPRTISYIEAHGTGTSLGDPIEITGLIKAFQKYTENKQFCVIGSAKSNIGHCESAAGIAGVTKVLLQLKNRQIVPSLHSEVLNPNIDFLNTPFIVQQTLTEWERPVVTIEGVSKEYPRIAGISSFGAGGSNAHIVIEEYIPGNQEQAPVRVTPQNPAIIVLSAKDEERLKERAQQLLTLIKEQQFTEADLANGYLAASRLLADIAYTLQVGREAMEERLGVITGSIEELTGKLAAFIAGQGGIEDLYRGQVKRNQEALTVFTADEDLQKAVESWVNKGKYGKLLDLWVKGMVFDWNQLYKENKPRRISLPTYPFAKESYWIPESAWVPVRATGRSPQPTLHPLLQQNTSDLSEQRYSSTFTGKEFFLADHIVNGQKILPGVAYLEMARAAIEEAAIARAQNTAEELRAIKIKNVVWARPIGVDEEPVQIHIGLYPENSFSEGRAFREGDGSAFFEGIVFEEDAIAYEIYSLAKNGATEEVVYSQGSATLSGNMENPVLDLKALQAECNGRKLSGTEVYNIYKTIGLDYGPGYRGIEMIYTGHGLVLAKLSLPSSVAGTGEEFVLHPSIMDGALQAAIGMGAGEPESMTTPKLSLPFALQEMEIYHRCTGSMWAVIQYSKDNSAVDSAADKIQKLDIDICDEQGNVCVRLKGFTSRVLESGIDEIGPVTSTGSLMLEPVWKEQAVLYIDGQIKAPEYIQQLVILCEPGAISPESIETGLNGVRVLSLQSKQKSIAKRYQTYAVLVFEALQKILTDKPAGKVLVQLVVASLSELNSREEQQLFAGFSGILKTAQLENPKVIGQIIEVETTENSEGYIAKLTENARRPMDSQIRYQGGKRQVAGWREVTVLPEAAKIPFKDGGVYLITGGAGDLGMIFAKEIAEQVKSCTLVLTGRSPLSEEKRAQLRGLESTEARVEYRPVDVSDGKAVNQLIGSIVEEFGKLDGIIHCAGIIRDNYIIKKSKEEFVEVLEPKVTGLVNLDEASKDLSLDFIIFFSSIAGSLGNPGQADYAAANAFMDAHAGYRNTLVSSGRRQGRTLSINWPLWQEGGMRVDETVEKMMRQSTGMVALRTGTGIRALYDGIASGRNQVMVMEGDIRQIRAMFSKQPVPAQSMNSGSNRMKQESGTVADQDLLREKVSNYLKKLLSPVIKLSVERIEADTPLEKYGIDSIMAMQLTNQLEKTFGSLSKTLFFEYQTIRELSGYFLESYREQLNQLIGIEKKEEVTSNLRTVTMSGSVMPVIRSRKRARFTALQPIQESKPNRPLDIAIIGVSGRYPGARNLQEFWQNLRDGKDCITEIPKDRWDYSRYFDEDKNKPGKTYSKWGGFLEGVAEFDPLFFNISPREAEFMDPQERLFLECVYETLEDAGYTRETLGNYQGLGLEGNVGVYVGVMYEEYQLYGAQAQIQGFPIALSGNPASIANRVSYFCNFHGPSVAVDTMCSSSLTAIHLACQSIQRGGCELAIAGGVNVSIHPNKYLMLAQGKFASSKGRCESFGEGGDGYVPGEGAGAVFLKPLSKAIADGDQIYGVIKGTAINHGGKTNGYSVPNPNAQAGVIGQALREAGIDPRTISYIEAHGTGTSLGDPIEITGLTKAFQKYTENKQFCTIGSAKSNIGHCESAAGIAGVTKVLLQLKHRQIAPSLHSEVLNPNIDFLNTPFIVQQELKEWERPVVTIEGVTREYPRIAGISSFGAGGSNAHVIIEEYNLESQEQTAITVTPRQPALIILSAKDEERLKEQAERLIAAIRERQLTDANLADGYLADGRLLADMAYTLQVGREAMEERLGVITGSIEELAGKLEAFLEGQSGIDDLYRGQVKRNQDVLTVFTADEEMQEAIQKWIERKKYGKLLDLWVKGLVFDWNKLYGDQKPRRISLPTYPFAKERYWVPEIDTKRTLAPNMGITSYIHPLLQQNTSDFSEQRYSSIFTGAEFFLTDHIVNGQKVLPGVAYLEIARAAVESATNAMTFVAAAAVSQTDRSGIRLKDVVWIRPIVVQEEPILVHIGLYPEDDAFSESGSGEINYEIYDETRMEDGMPLIYSQGRAFLTTEPELLVLDLKAVQAECSERILQAAEVYETFRLMGIEYGPSHRGVEQIYVGNGQILAKLSLPTAINETQEQFVLHPSLMDAALQASIGLGISFEDRYLLESKVAPTGALKPMLPFALEELEVIGSCASNMWALIRNSEGGKVGDKVWKLDIDLCDEQGHICVRLKGLSSRVLEGEIPTATRTQPVSVTATPEVQAGTIMLTPTWETVSMKRVETSPTLSDRVVMIGGTKGQRSNIQKQYPNIAILEIQISDSIDEIIQKLTEYGMINHILWIAPNHQLKSVADETLIKGQNQGVLQVFKIIKALLKLGYRTKELGFSLITNRAQAVHKNDEVNPTHASLYGLVGSMAKEYLNWNIRLIDLESSEDWPISDIFTIAPDPEGNALAYRGGEWYRQQLIPVWNIPTKQTLYKHGGVYVVIGGAGGIGEAWSEYVIRTYQAQVIWIGRRAKDENIQAKIDRLASFGPKPQYIVADATKRKALEEAYQEIKRRYSKINGVIHSAIVLLDKSLMNMTEERFQAGLSAKVDVSVRMAQVFKEEPLDFVLFFSSMQSYTKAAGQSNYASGCTFKDAFAHQLRREWPCVVKVINWGYWGNVGIVASLAYQERMAQAGIGSIEPPEAMEALEKLLAGPMDQIALMKMTKLLTMEGMNPENLIKIYPEDLPSAIGNIQDYLIVPDFNEVIQNNGG